MQSLKLAQSFALLALSLAVASCGGRSQKATSPASAGKCHESPRSYPDSSEGDAASAPASMDSEGDYSDGDDCSPAPSAPMEDKSTESEISRLWNEIRDQRVAVGLAPEPLVSESTEVESMSVDEIQSDQDHPEPKSEVCISTCKIEASICKNADSICRLANNLSGNQWAAEKCNSGKASCREATKKCADCVAGESGTLSE